MFHLLWTALIGLIVGAIAKLIMPGKDPGGIFVTMLIGITGSFIGTFLGRAIGHYEPNQSAGSSCPLSELSSCLASTT
jgi:uncharacterized membrane protein YeaQ/YmgE (transglycosylase-associated protein family)